MIQRTKQFRKLIDQTLQAQEDKIDGLVIKNRKNYKKIIKKNHENWVKPDAGIRSKCVTDEFGDLDFDADDDGDREGKKGIGRSAGSGLRVYILGGVRRAGVRSDGWQAFPPFVL